MSYRRRLSSLHFFFVASFRATPPSDWSWGVSGSKVLSCLHLNWTGIFFISSLVAKTFRFHIMKHWDSSVALFGFCPAFLETSHSTDGQLTIFLNRCMHTIRGFPGGWGRPSVGSATFVQASFSWALSSFCPKKEKHDRLRGRWPDEDSLVLYRLT